MPHPSSLARDRWLHVKLLHMCAQTVCLTTLKLWYIGQQAVAHIFIAKDTPDLSGVTQQT